MKYYFKIIFFATSSLMSFSFVTTNPVKYYGFFKATQIRVYYDTSLINSFFQGTGFLPVGGANKLNAYFCRKSGNMTFNNKQMSYNGSVRAYFDTIGSKTFEGINWSLNSSDSLPVINYACTLGYPIINSRINIPNNISKSADFFVDISSATNYDEVEFIINDSQLKIFTPWNRKLSNVSSITIPKTDLSTLSGPVVKMNLILIKNETVSLNGKNFKFENRIMFVKEISIN